jgi:hypothetical protein
MSGTLYFILNVLTQKRFADWVQNTAQPYYNIAVFLARWYSDGRLVLGEEISELFCFR